MQWFLLRRLIELLFIPPLIEAFANCHGVWDGVKMVNGLDEIHKIGLLACALIAGSCIVELIAQGQAVVKKIVDFIRDLFRRPKP